MAQMTINLFTFAMFLCSTASAAAPESVAIGPARYDVIVDRPAGKGPFPLLVIAPALKYTMTSKSAAPRITSVADTIGVHC